MTLSVTGAEALAGGWQDEGLVSQLMEVVHQHDARLTTTTIIVPVVLEDVETLALTLELAVMFCEATGCG